MHPILMLILTHVVMYLKISSAASCDAISLMNTKWHGRGESSPRLRTSPSNLALEEHVVSGITLLGHGDLPLLLKIRRQKLAK